MKNRLLPWVVLLSCCISCKKYTGSSQSPTSPTGPSTDSWKQKASIPNPSPPDGRGIGIGFSIGNFGYIGLGTDNGIDFDDLYRYDPASDTWAKMASLSTGLESSVCLIINNKVYAGTGESRQLADYTNQWYEYDPSTNVWTRKADFPGTKRESALGAAIGGKGYVGLGYSPGGKMQYDLWQYDPATDKWSQQANFPDSTACPIFPANRCCCPAPSSSTVPASLWVEGIPIGNMTPPTIPGARQPSLAAAQAARLLPSATKVIMAWEETAPAPCIRTYGNIRPSQKIIQQSHDAKPI